MRALFGECEVADRHALSVVADFEHVHVAVLVEVCGEMAGGLEVDYAGDCGPGRKARRVSGLEESWVKNLPVWSDVWVDAPLLGYPGSPVVWVFPTPLALLSLVGSLRYCFTEKRTKCVDQRLLVILRGHLINSIGHTLETTKLVFHGQVVVREVLSLSQHATEADETFYCRYIRNCHISA